MANNRRLVILCCLAWLLAIYATSSTVITPQVFFDWFHENLFQSDALFYRFQLFWGASWLFIVKGWHVAEFAILMLLMVCAIDLCTRQQSFRNVLLAAIVCIVYAASDEWHQTFVPNRGGVFYDVLIDSLGVVLAAAYILRVRRSRKTSNGKPLTTGGAVND